MPLVAELRELLDHQLDRIGGWVFPDLPAHVDKAIPCPDGDPVGYLGPIVFRKIRRGIRGMIFLYFIVYSFFSVPVWNLLCPAHYIIGVPVVILGIIKPQGFLRVCVIIRVSRLCFAARPAFCPAGVPPSRMWRITVPPLWQSRLILLIITNGYDQTPVSRIAFDHAQFLKLLDEATGGRFRPAPLVRQLPYRAAKLPTLDLNALTADRLLRVPPSRFGKQPRPCAQPRDIASKEVVFERRAVQEREAVHQQPHFPGRAPQRKHGLPVVVP